MLSPSQLQTIRHHLMNGTLEAYLNRMEEISHEYICDITWQTDDIKSIRPHYTDEQLQEAAQYVAGVLQDRSTEEGWDILEIALSCWEK